MLDQLQIKVCGITDINQALALDALCVDYIGFIFYAPSKRYVLNNVALTDLKIFTPTHAKKVGVFVNESIESIVNTVVAAGLDMVQLHGDEDALYYSLLKSKFNELAQEKTTINNKNGVLLKIYPRDSANPMDVAQLVKQKLEVIQKNLPSGMELTILQDNSIFLNIRKIFGFSKYYHFLQLQYLAFVLGPGVSQLCLALKDFLAFGLDFLIFIVFSPLAAADVPPCPKFTFLTFLVFGSLTYTLNFLTSPCIGLFSLTLRPWYSASNVSCSHKL